MVRPIWYGVFIPLWCIYTLGAVFHLSHSLGEMITESETQTTSLRVIQEDTSTKSTSSRCQSDAGKIEAAQSGKH